MVECSARILGSALLTEIDPGNRLLAGYTYGLPDVCELFAHPLTEIATLACRAHAQADRPTLAAALTGYQQHLGAGDAALVNARLLADPTTPVITVGQQSGLLTGPLYTIYKAVSAIVMARRLAQTLGRPVVPVFWAATDDDDRQEADHVSLWDGQYGLHTIHYPEGAGKQGQLIGDLPAGAYGEEILEQITPLLAGLPYAGEVSSLLRATLADSADMGEWFCRLMSRLLSDMGLVLCDPRLPGIRCLASEVLLREIAAPLRTTELVNRQARILQQRGFHPALIKPADTCNFFFVDGTRHRVIYQHGRYCVGTATYTPRDLLDLLAGDPGRLLPNAVLRPVVQEYLFGSAAFIAGPHELGYWAELAPVFVELAVEMPVVVPRAGATIVPPFVARRLTEWGIVPFDLLFRSDQVRYTLLERQQPPGIGEQFAGSREILLQMSANLSEAVAQVDATLAQSALATHQRMLNELERLERKTLKAVERQSGDLSERLNQARELLFPGHGLQERALNIYSLLARHGLNLTAKLPELFDGQESRHLIVEL